MTYSRINRIKIFIILTLRIVVLRIVVVRIVVLRIVCYELSCYEMSCCELLVFPLTRSPGKLRVIVHLYRGGSKNDPQAVGRALDFIDRASRRTIFRIYDAYAYRKGGILLLCSGSLSWSQNILLFL